jgi:hypothetical protein
MKLFAALTLLFTLNSFAAHMKCRYEYETLHSRGELKGSFRVELSETNDTNVYTYNRYIEGLDSYYFDETSSSRVATWHDNAKIHMAGTVYADDDIVSLSISYYNYLRSPNEYDVTYYGRMVTTDVDFSDGKASFDVDDEDDYEHIQRNDAPWINEKPVEVESCKIVL